MTKHVLGFSGFSGSGKTTLIEKLIPVLRREGLRIAVIKHDAHEIQTDREGKDTARFAAVGADTVFIASKKQTVRFDAMERSLEEMIREIHGVDLILVEGYKYAKIPQIGVTSKRVGGKLPKPAEEYLGYATDVPSEPDGTAFSLDDTEEIGRFVLNCLINKRLDLPNIL